MSGPSRGHLATEAHYAAERLAGDVYVVSYAAASGYALTVTLNFANGTMLGFASGHGEWFPGRGRFEVVR